MIVGTVSLMSVWLVVLTLVVTVLLRQVSIVTRKLSNSAPGLTPERFSLMINADLPAEVLALAPQLRDGVTYVVYLSATCSSCRQVAVQLPETLNPEYLILPIVSGSERLTQGFTELWRGQLTPITGTDAETLIETLSLTSTPFVVQIFRGRIAGWTTVHDIGTDIEKLHEALLRALDDRGSPFGEEVSETPGQVAGTFAARPDDLQELMGLSGPNQGG